MQAILDTNVLVVANDPHHRAVIECRAACVKFANEARDHAELIIDDAGEVMEEYLGAIATDRPHGIGARFVIELIHNQGFASRVQRVELCKDKNDEFVAFPKTSELERFDRSDRKFAALAKRTGVPVTNAVDSDWLDYRAPLAANGIHVVFLCGCDRTTWFEADL